MMISKSYFSFGILLKCHNFSIELASLKFEIACVHCKILRPKYILREVKDQPRDHA